MERAPPLRAAEEALEQGATPSQVAEVITLMFDHCGVERLANGNRPKGQRMTRSPLEPHGRRRWWPAIDAVSLIEILAAAAVGLLLALLL